VEEGCIKLSTDIDKYISVNLRNFVKGNTILLDLCGEPGDAFLHIEKMVGFLCIS
jgi:hypothetical protein